MAFWLAGVKRVANYHCVMSKSSVTIKLVIFDFDGTLASSLEGITACMGHTFQRFGYPAPSADEVKATVGLTLEDSIRKLTRFACPESAIPAVVGTYRELHAREAPSLTKLFDGAADAVARIKEEGLKTVLVSNKGSAGLLQLLEEFKIRCYFDLVLSSDRYPKPSAALYDTCIAPEFPHIGRGEVLVVGDTESDLRFAANIGARSCWAAFGYGDEEACKALGPDFVISDVRQLPHILSVHSGGPTSP